MTVIRPVLVCFLLIITSIESVSAEPKRPDHVYAKVQALNEKLVHFLRHDHSGEKLVIVSPIFQRREIQPRHVYQKALDVELKLAGILRANGIEVTETQKVELRPYAPDQVFAVMDRIIERVDRLLTSHDLAFSSELGSMVEKKPRDVYQLLRRVERFLLKMGASTTMPGHVLRRARVLAGLVKKLCLGETCKGLSLQEVTPGEIIIPRNVYKETYDFIHELNQFVEKKKVPLRGGVIALPALNTLVTPADVNEVMSTALADTIGVIQHYGHSGYIELKGVDVHAMPRDVWQQIQYARRVIARLNSL
ncbi:hypothetical protein [Terasakiella sp. SH-1]|uniref:hypothetical protein n=1 Tax=Terasakiella sp. SH-1 TaxID=2560057 RepID=UPI0010741279|nr:hypothetical protein [Terasakiella sp. SH-1]